MFSPTASIFPEAFSKQLLSVPKLLVLSLILCCLQVIGIASDTKIPTPNYQFGTYPFETYTSKDFGVFEDTSVWAIAEGDSGFIYGSTQIGMVRFDGQRWIQIQLPDGTWANSLINIPGRGILVASQEAFYLYDENTRQFKTIDWDTDNPNYTYQFNFVLGSDNSVYFEKFRSLYQLGLEDHVFKKIETEFGFSEGAYLANADLYTYRDLVFPLQHPEGLKTGPLNWKHRPQNSYAIVAHPVKPSTWEGISYHGNLLRYECRPESSSIVCTKSNHLPKKLSNVVSVHWTASHHLVVATKNLGVWILDDIGNLLHHISNDNYPIDLAEISKAIVDAQGGLWIAHENGIVHIDIDSQIRYLEDRYLKIPEVTDVLEFKNRLLFGTSTGLLEVTWNPKIWERQISSFSVANEKHWDLEQVGRAIWVTVENEGVYSLPESLSKEEAPVLIEAGRLPRELEFLPQRNRFFITSYTEQVKIGELSESDESPTVFAQTDHLEELIFKTDLDRNEVLWMTAIGGKLFYLPTRDITSVPAQKLPAPSKVNGLTEGTNLSLEVGETETIASINDQIFEIDEQTFAAKTLKIPAPMELADIPFRYISLTHLVDQQYAASISFGNRIIHRVLDLKGLRFVPDAYRQLCLLDNFATNNAKKAKDGVLWFTGGIGAARFDPNQQTLTREAARLSFDEITLGEQVFPASYKDQKLNLGVFPHTFRTFSVSVSFPSYLQKFDKALSHEFTFQLSGRVTQTSVTNNGHFEFPNLSPGVYQLEVVARDAIGQHSKPIALGFRILPPWYASNLAIILYVVVGLILMLFFVRWRLEVQKRELWEERLENERKLQLESAAKDAQLQALRLQINPHFLFNSLNFISNSLTTNPPVKESIDRLSNFLKHALDERNSKLIRLRDELEAIKQYLEIEQGKSKRALAIQYDIDPETLNLLVPGLIVQPIIENALKYGTLDADGILQIQLQSCLDQAMDMLKVVVRNSGQWKESVTGRTPIGMKNVEKRLVLQYGDKAKLKVENRSDIHAVEITLLMPMMNEE